MPTGRGSHRWCSVCHARWIDKSKHKNMCKVCYSKWDKRIRQERQRIKARRAARQAPQNGVTTMAEEPQAQPAQVEASPNGTQKRTPQEQAAYMRSFIKPENRKGNRNGTGGRKPKTSLTPEQEVEIIRLYTDTNEPVSEIARAFGVTTTYPYRVLEKHGVTKQRQHHQAQGKPRAKAPLVLEEDTAPAQVVHEVPEPVEKALERMLKLPPNPEPIAQPVLRPMPEDMRAELEHATFDPSGQPSYFGRDDEAVWEISYVGRMLVRASTIDQALERARADGHLTQIVGVTMRSR